MAITLDGAKVKNIDIKKDEEGKLKITGTYELMSSAGTVVAKQNFGGYADMTYTPSAETQKLIMELTQSVGKDINTTMGFA